MFRHVLILLTFALSAGVASGQTAPDSDRPAPDLYKANCQACHMADGNAALEPMNFADGKWRHGTAVADLAKIISNGVPGTAMMPFKTRFSDREILALAKYVRTFDKTLKPETAARRRRKP
jgi:aldose sugar dehydrogenase